MDHRLPADVLSAAFSWLSLPEQLRLARVSVACRRAAETARPEAKALDLKWCRGRRQLGDAAQFFSERAAHWTGLQSVHLYGPLAGKALPALLPALGPQLRSLEIESKQMDDAALGAVARFCAGGLRSLRLHECQHVTDAGMALVAAASPLLLEVCVDSCHRLTDDTVRALARHCHQLAALDVQKCFHISDDCLRAIGARSSLRALNLNRCLKLSDAGLSGFATSLRNSGAALEVLELSSCCKITSAGVMDVLNSGVTRLREVGLGGCPAISDACLMALVQVASSTLTSLDVTGCERLTAAGVEALAACRRLRCLRLTRVHVNDGAVQRLAAALPDLEELQLRMCAVTDAAVAACARLPRLRSLDCTGCYELTDRAVLALVHADDRTRARSSSSDAPASPPGGGAEDAAGDVAAAVGVSGGGAARADDEAAPVLPLTPSSACASPQPWEHAGVGGKSALRVVSLRLCNKLTVAAFEALAQQCPALEQVSLGGVGSDEFTRECVAALHRHRPRCSVTM